MNSTATDDSVFNRFYKLFTEYEAVEGACLDPQYSSVGTGLEGISWFLRFALVLGISVAFVRWQIKHNEDPPVVPPIPNLEDGSGRVQCIGLGALRPNINLVWIRLATPFTDRPHEYLSTGMWHTFIFTWPYQPRFYEPLLTHATRMSITVVKLLMQILLFSVLGKANSSASAVLQEDGISLTTIFAVLSIYTVSIAGLITHEVLVLVYGLAYDNGGITATTVFIVTGIFVGCVLLMMTSVLSHFSCSGFLTTVVLPFLMKQPLALVASPFVYAAKNSFGLGPGVEGILEAYHDASATFKSEDDLRQALRQYGRGVDNPWLNDQVDEELGEIDASATSTKPGESLDSSSSFALSPIIRRFASIGFSSKAELHSQESLLELLKRTIYIIYATPFLRDEYEKYAETPSTMTEGAVSTPLRRKAGSKKPNLGASSMLLELNAKRKYITGSPHVAWCMSLESLDQLLGNLQTALVSTDIAVQGAAVNSHSDMQVRTEDGNAGVAIQSGLKLDAAGGKRVDEALDLPPDVVDNLRILLRQVAWIRFTDSRRYHEFKRAAKARGHWGKPKAVSFMMSAPRDTNKSKLRVTNPLRDSLSPHASADAD